ncbi:hypothetical protein [Glycomyces xiaoerkulensis]|uniref:hypothetical protein n=1 Tax=Glycomyces xiaoerkulensis TaxID=2038139 RepID=UPI0012FFF087|nr:hypothetical protein [Glycomyces xiaoerkulensis]
MSESSPSTRRAAKPYAKYLVLYLILTIGSVWALTLFYLLAYDFAVDTLGELGLRNPVVVVILHSPAIAALLVLFLYDRWRGLANFGRSLVPRKKDLLWIPALLALMFGYIFAIRYLCILFGIDVPPEPQSPVQMVLTFLELFYMEVGMVAIAIGWFGFFLPFMHRLTGKHVSSGVLTGLGIAVFVAPGNVFASFELAIAWPLYAAQLCVLCIGMSFLLSRMKGNVLFFLLPFWASASGSAMQLYYFAIPTQFVQLTLFAVLVAALYLVLKRQAGGGELDPPFAFPGYLEREYTVRMGAVFPGSGDRSREGRSETRSEAEPVGAGREATS